MSQRVLDVVRQDRPRASRSRWLLGFAIATSAIVVVLFSALIVSFFVTAGFEVTARTDAPAIAGEPFTVALVRTPGGSREWRTYVGAIRRMGDAIHRPMRLRYVESRTEMAGLLMSGRVDAAFMCIYCYLEVADAPGVALVAVPTIAGHSKDAAVLVVRQGSAYRALSDLRRRRIGVTGRTSLGGHAYLLWLAKREGVDVDRSLTLVAADSQEQSIRALLAGDVDAVVVNRSQLASWDTDGIRIVATSPEFGMPPFVTGKTVDAATRGSMQRALLAMRPSSEVTPTSIQGFTVPHESDYSFARVLEAYTREPGREE